MQIAVCHPSQVELVEGAIAAAKEDPSLDRLGRAYGDYVVRNMQFVDRVEADASMDPGRVDIRQVVG